MNTITINISGDENKFEFSQTVTITTFNESEEKIKSILEKMTKIETNEYYIRSTNKEQLDILNKLDAMEKIVKELQDKKIEITQSTIDSIALLVRQGGDSEKIKELFKS